MVISKIKNTIPWTYIINDLNSDEKWKDYDNSFNSWIDRKDIVKMSQYFSKPCEPLGGDINVKVDLFSYVTKPNLRKARGTDTYLLALKSNLASQKAGIDKIDVEKLKTVLVDLNKLSNVVNNDVVKNLFMIN